MNECVEGAQGCCSAARLNATPDPNFLEKLRVYKQVCHKVRSSLVAGRDEIVSPTSFLDALIESNNKKLVGSSGSIDSGIFPGEAPAADSPKGAPKAERSGSRNSNGSGNGGECRFVEPAEGWTIEYSDKWCESCGANAMCVCPRPSPSMGLRPMAEAAYREHFYQKDHFNFFTEEPDIGPCLLSMKKEGETKNYRLLIRSSDFYLHMIVSGSALCGGHCADHMELVDIIGREMKLCCPFQPAQYPAMDRELLKIDETFVKTHHKVGVLSVKQGQCTEEEIFGNLYEPGPFDDFLNVLGKRVELKGFKGFLGGLDSERKLTGEYSVFTEFQNLEVMFHVAPLLPYTPNDSQQVNKKRHIGNDIVCVVFLDNAQTIFNPTWIRSHFIHCYLVIQRVQGAHGQPLYKVAVTKRSTVPSFTPELKYTSVFAHSKTLQQFLLTKMINGERASYHAPRFLKLTNRSRGQLLHEFSANFKEYTMACKQGRATRKVSKRSNWLPIGASRPPSPLMDAVREKYTNNDKLAEDFSVALRGCELADVMFVVGEEKKLVYGVKAILACRSRVFRTMFKESKSLAAPARFSSPLVRRKIPSHGCSTQYTPLGGRKSRLPGLGIMKKKGSVPDDLMPCPTSQESNSLTPLIQRSFSEDPRHVQIKEQYVIEGFTELEFGELLNYLTTGSCTINHTNIVGLACVAERYEVEELKKACYDNLSRCLTIRTVCTILTQLEKFLAFTSAKTMIIQSLEFVDSNAVELLSSEDMKNLSENMVHLVLRRDTDVPEVLKVKAAFAWGEVNARPGQGPDFKTLVTPLVKHVRLHLIDPQDIMKICVPSGIFDMDKIMTALAYQADPQSIETDSYTMFRPRKKSNVLSSR